MHLLRKRIYAILFHLSSSDSHLKHMHCPPGIKSWCFWQRAQARTEEPGSHKDHEPLPADVGKLLVPIFQRLSEESLLTRCMRARTKNANESLHQIVWKFCPKAMYAGKRTIETAVAQWESHTKIFCTSILVLSLEFICSSIAWKSQ